MAKNNECDSALLVNMQYYQIYLSTLLLKTKKASCWLVNQTSNILIVEMCVLLKAILHTSFQWVFLFIFWTLAIRLELSIKFESFIVQVS